MVRTAPRAGWGLLAALLTTLAFFISSGEALAASAPAINAQTYEFAPAQYDGVLVRSARQQRADGWQLGASLHYARRALTFANRSGDAALVQTVLGDLWMLDLGVARTFRQWTFEATLPVALGIRGGGPNLLNVDRPLAPAFGDLRLGARRQLWKGDAGPLGRVDLAAMLLWAAPTGANGGWLSDGGARLDALGLATARRAGWQIDVALGFRLRPLAELNVVTADATTGQPKVDANGALIKETVLAVGSEWLVQLGAGRRWLGERLGSRVELQFKGALDGEATSSQTLADVLVQADWRLARGAWHVFGAVGGAMTTGYGSAQMRALAGLRFDPGLLPNDADLDGLDDRETIKICVGYNINGEIHEFPPAERDHWDDIVPVYQEVPGWQESTTACRAYDDLPQLAKDYLARIEELTGAPVSYVGVGPDREQTIIR